MHAYLSYVLASDTCVPLALFCANHTCGYYLELKCPGSRVPQGSRCPGACQSISVYSRYACRTSPRSPIRILESYSTVQSRMRQSTTAPQYMLLFFFFKLLCNNLHSCNYKHQLHTRLHHQYEAEPARVYRTAPVGFASGIVDCLWFSNGCQRGRSEMKVVIKARSP